jgi:hypothetical protein
MTSGRYVMTQLRRTAAAGFAALVVAVGVSGCASQAYDPTPSTRAPVSEIAFIAPLDVERSYRRLYQRLEACVGTGYHVHPRYEHTPQRAWIMVVSGLGLNRLSFLVNQFEARFNIEPAPQGARISVTYLGTEMERLARAAEAWLVRGDRGCAA